MDAADIDGRACPVIKSHLLIAQPRTRFGGSGGAVIALDAYHASLNNESAPLIDGLTGDQRFFLAYAQSWRDKRREANVRKLVVSNPHSPEQYRVNGVLRNVDAWYQAFNIKPGDKLYLAPSERVRIW